MKRFKLLVSVIIMLAFGFQTGLADEPKEEGMLTGAPEELLPSDAINENLGIKVKMSQVSPNVLNLTIPDKGGYYLEIALYKTEKGETVAGSRIWSQNAIHEIKGLISIAGYTIEAESGKSVVFRVDLQKGYVFVSGQGKITLRDKKTVALDNTKQGFILGHPPRSPVVKKQKLEPFLIITKGQKSEETDKKDDEGKKETR